MLVCVVFTSGLWGLVVAPGGLWAACGHVRTHVQPYVPLTLYVLALIRVIDGVCLKVVSWSGQVRVHKPTILGNDSLRNS